MTLRRRLFAVLFPALALNTAAAAQGIELLSEFIDGHDQGRVAFEQETFDEEGGLLSKTRGALSFIRPDRFRVEYYEPFPQLILGDGTKVWYYDRDLAQATVHEYRHLSGHSALSLLTGERIQQNFVLTSAPGKDDGYHWVHAVPVAEDRSFEEIWIAFDRGSGVLSRMEIADVFSNRLVLTFSEIEKEADEDSFVADFPVGTAIVEGGE